MTPEYLAECFEYDPLTGGLTWRVRPREHFPDDQTHARWNGRHAGKPAGTRHSKGYIHVAVQNKKRFAHRIIWLLMTGSEPFPTVDHINGDKSDNRWANLRRASHAEQQQNLGIGKLNTSGYVGVHKHADTNKWCAQIMGPAGRKHLGLFDTPEAAHEAYVAAKKELHPFNPEPRG